MTLLSREHVFLILQFLEEEKFNETVRKLEQELGFYFTMKHFEEAVLDGEWDEVEKYLSNFTKVDDNHYSMKVFFEIRKQKYLEALDNYTARSVESGGYLGEGFKGLLRVQRGFVQGDHTVAHIVAYDSIQDFAWNR